jgi:hypothetical protein
MGKMAVNRGNADVFTAPLPPPSVQMASMTGFSASQAWDNVNVSAGRDFNFSINGPGDITDERERYGSFARRVIHDI